MPLSFGSPGADIAVAILLGLLVGSFLNVVAHRLPGMLERRWARECAEAGLLAGGETSGGAAAPCVGTPDSADTGPTLMRPRSACPHCGHTIRWHHNIPVLGWLWLRGRCHDCGARISPRYPLVELASGAIFGFAAWRWGLGAAGAAWAGFGATLLVLALIDWDTTLLPDDLTLPLVWAGLIAATLGWSGVPLADALWGAVGGYLFLWAVFQAFRLLTGKEGMGYGDFKLLAALGAWFGWQALIPLVLMSSILGTVAGLLMKMTIGLVDGRYVQFGPWLAAAGGVLMVMGTTPLLRVLGL